jgi:hypothetical protein
MSPLRRLRFRFSRWVATGTDEAAEFIEWVLDAVEHLHIIHAALFEHEEHAVTAIKVVLATVS